VVGQFRNVEVHAECLFDRLKISTILW